MAGTWGRSVLSNANVQRTGGVVDEFFTRKTLTPFGTLKVTPHCFSTIESSRCTDPLALPVCLLAAAQRPAVAKSVRLRITRFVNRIIRQECGEPLSARLRGGSVMGDADLATTKVCGELLTGLLNKLKGGQSLFCQI